MEPTIVDAIYNLCKKNHINAAVTITGDNESIKDLSTTILRDGGTLGFTFEDATNELASLKLAWDAQEYARNRQSEYPSIQELVVGLYDTDDKSAIEAKRAAVKLKYPKPE